MDNPIDRMLFLKAKIDPMLDDLVKQVPGTNTVEVLMAMTAMVGTAIRSAPPHVKERLFASVIAVLAQEAGVHVVQAQMNAADFANLGAPEKPN